MANTHTFSKQEELVNAITHGIGVLLSIAALALLIVFASLKGTAMHVTSFTIFGATMLLLYCASTLVHSFPEGKLKDLFEIFDHSAIYLFIAGTYTPILLTLVRGTTGWVLFGIIWGIALLGLVFKAFLTKKFLVTSTLLYIAMGWLIIFAWRPLLQHSSTECLVLLIVGGLLYTVGTIFYVWRGFKFHHAVWHLFVLGGSVFHFFAILYIVL